MDMSTSAVVADDSERWGIARRVRGRAGLCCRRDAPKKGRAGEEGSVLGSQQVGPAASDPLLLFGVSSAGLPVWL